ncbi:MAG: 16S rRNA (cytidine(1402)-2'-O)-methyltransferase [Verrucomicrobiota bacterium]
MANSSEPTAASISEPGRGAICLIATPIGNLGDLSYRAVEYLRRADLIACEDTRHSRRLLQHYQITDRECISLHQHNESTRADLLIERALSGDRVALISDAGMPTVSDPGFRVVEGAIAAGAKLEIIPGPSAVIAALAGSGFPTDRFYFGGFLPVKSGKREAVLRQSLERPETAVYFESPHRLLKTLRCFAEIAPDRPLCIARELTKSFETFHRGLAGELLAEWGEDTPVKGEITLLHAGAPKPVKSAKENKYRRAGHSPP